MRDVHVFRLMRVNGQRRGDPRIQAAPEAAPVPLKTLPRHSSTARPLADVTADDGYYHQGPPTRRSKRFLCVTPGRFDCCQCCSASINAL